AIEAGAPGGYYNSPSLDGKRPGIYWINLRDTKEQAKYTLTTLTVHEGVPGHHLQLSLSNEAQGLPLIRKIVGFSGYAEGWALYSEQLAVEMDIWMIRNGMSTSFDTIIASGKRGALPHGAASDKIMQKGELVTLDFGGYLDYYTSDMTRTVCLGKADDKQKEIYDIVLDSQLAGIKAAKAGLKGKEVDSIARGMIESKGYGQYFGHGLGHGVGLEVHEEPRFSVMDENTIEPGMVISVEPGIYIPGWGGVRIEDLVVITETDAEVLYESPKHLIEL
ncbi:MAG TPA: DUF885 family protein, partial [Bacillota bacterium]|nr:DUF885 family protein [Bacillota bacterium]